MRTHLKRLFILFYLSFLIFITILHKEEIFEITINTLSLWLYKIFPPIFIFYIISSLLISSKAINIIFIIFKPLRNILKFETDNAFKLFLLSILIGNPSSSTFVVSNLQNNNITKNDAIILNKTASFITPLFIFSLLDLKIALLIYLSHLASNIFICIFLTRKNNILNNLKEPKIMNFFDYLNNIPKILFSIATMMVICNILIYSLTLLNINKNYLFFIELSTGAYQIISMTTQLKYYLLIFLLSFNGICIHLQVYSIIKDSLSYLSFLKYRLIQGFLSVILFLLIYTNFT